MPYETLTGGLELVIPTNGTTNWGTIVRNSTWLKINNHGHTGSPDGEQLSLNALLDYTITGVKLSKNFAWTVIPTYTPAGTTETVNWNDGIKAKIDLSSATGDVTVTLSNPLDGAEYRMIIEQGGTPRTIVWPAAVLWPGGEDPTQFMEANTTAMILFEYDGTNYFGRWELNYV